MRFVEVCRIVGESERMSTATPTPGDIRVWYIPQVPMTAYEVDVPSRDLDEARRLLDALVGLSVFEFEHHVKPDYSDAAGIVRYEVGRDGGYDWYDVDEDDE